MQYVFYKKKSALQLSLVKPKIKKSEKGYPFVDREGVVLLEIAPAIGDRKYNWEQKITFSLNAMEIATLLQKVRKNEEFKAFHDPNMGSADQSLIQKGLMVKRSDKSDGIGFFLNEKNNGDTKKYMFIMSPEEFELVNILLRDAVPTILGWRN